MTDPIETELNRSQKTALAGLLIAICAVAAGLRFWQLDQLPPGLYRDEAFNGLDALGILNGEHALFFTANNGREPLYIYLSSIFVAIFGRTPVAVRLAAAVLGTLTTGAVYAVSKSWYGRLVGLFAAWLWAVTVLPIHLSRLGLRVIVAVPVTALAMWLGTLAYRKNKMWLWAMAGACVGLGFYTYLSARLLPAVLVLIVVAVAIQQKSLPWRGLAWGLAGWGVMMLPLLGLWWFNPELLGGRTGQVSILNPDINQGNLVGTFFRNVWAALRLFFIEGDSIVRHNPPGRPLFDPFMAVPFLVGLFLLGREWRKTTTLAVVGWVSVMLAATILAEDTPHFLRASGILPAALIPAALGLAWGWRLPRQNWLGKGAVVFILLGSFWFTIQDYFVAYPAQPATGYLFESAAREMAERINADPADRPIFVDQRYQDNWPSQAFLLNPERELIRLDHRNLVDGWFTGPFVFYVSPIAGLDMGQMIKGVQTNSDQPILISTQTGPLTRGDLETTAYPLYIRFAVSENESVESIVATLEEEGDGNGSLYTLHSAELNVRDDENKLIVDLIWSANGLVQDRNDIVFVHILDRQTGQVVAQSDSVPGQGFWPVKEWRSNMQIHDQHEIFLGEEWDSARFQPLIGIYPADNPQNRLQIRLPNGQTGGNTVEIR